MRKFCFFVILFLSSVLQVPVNSGIPEIASMRRRAEIHDAWLLTRLEQIVPALMRREKIDMWIIIAREYNEDPVIKTMLPAIWLAARRRTVLVFSDRKETGFERLAVARYNIGDFFTKAWDKDQQPDQWRRLAEIIREHSPERIALNISPVFALADGLSHSEYEAFMSAIPDEFKNQIVSGEKLAIGWLETRTESERIAYTGICRIAHEIIAEGFSNQVIHPGITTTDDVEWWYREKIRELKLTTWFHPSVSVQRAQEPEKSDSFESRPQEMTILPGDLLHVDFGISYLGLHTDTQRHAYVLRPEENDVPEAFKKALRNGNRMQDIVNANFTEGRTGNEILSRSLQQAEKEGIEATIYTHPIGFHGHGAGSTIGLWDQQQGVPGKGDYPLYVNTAHSNELNIAVSIPEWSGKKIRIMLEEDILYTSDGVRFIDGRQTRFHLIR